MLFYESCNILYFNLIQNSPNLNHLNYICKREKYHLRSWRLEYVERHRRRRLFVAIRYGLKCDWNNRKKAVPQQNRGNFFYFPKSKSCRRKIYFSNAEETSMKMFKSKLNFELKRKTFVKLLKSKIYVLNAVKRSPVITTFDEKESEKRRTKSELCESKQCKFRDNNGI